MDLILSAMDRLIAGAFTDGMTQNTHAPQFGEQETVDVLGGMGKTGRRAARGVWNV
jgi:hypothetical protein